MVVHEGSNVTLQCAATGYPNPTITWRREDNHNIVISNALTGKHDLYVMFMKTSASTLICVRINRGLTFCVRSAARRGDSSVTDAFMRPNKTIVNCPIVNPTNSRSNRFLFELILAIQCNGTTHCFNLMLLVSYHTYVYIRSIMKTANNLMIRQNTSLSVRIQNCIP